MKEKAVSIPAAMRGCIDFPEEELMQLKYLLDKTRLRMESQA